ncbi:response regulator [Prosthecodimorpha staleyi]|uniref:response regulator n=1 Tax=Prosthecodimorpha staleyi TaxID=2840188 RepID=UPI0021C2B6CA|nr:response regulator [Prosthecodimorpha staleyi]
MEDEALLAALLAEVLIDMGHTVDAIVATEADAVRAAKRLKPDLMIVDFRLREGTGADAVAKILTDGFVPHVYMSGDRLNIMPRHARAVVLEKPFRDSDLMRAIDRAVGETTDA